MFQFTGLSSITYGFSYGYTDMTLYGLPHSDISGSKPACGSPKLFAAYRVLHRLLAPRHPPYALSNLTISCALLQTHMRDARLYLRRLVHLPFISLPLPLPSAVFSSLCSTFSMQFSKILRQRLLHRLAISSSRAFSPPGFLGSP